VAGIVVGRLAGLDRTGQVVTVEDGEGRATDLPYDRLVLLLERTHYSLGLAGGRARETAANYCVPDCLQEAARCLRWVQGCCGEARRQEGYIIVLGLNLHALAVVNSVIEAGAPPACVLLVRTAECGAAGGREHWHEDGAVRNRVLNSLRVLGVRVKAYSLVDCRRDKARPGIIEAVVFSKGEELVEAACMLLVNCTRPCLAPRLARVLERADLVYLQGALVTDRGGRTSDARVVAGGGATRLGRLALAEAQGTEPLRAPEQVGRQLARTVLEQGENEGEQQGHEDEENDDDDAEEDGEIFPVHLEAELPGGLTYLFLGTGATTQAKLSTSSADTGEFRLGFDRRDRVSSLHCLARGYLPSQHLARLRGCPRSLLPGLADSPPDLIAYFQQPPVLAIFHDGFPRLRREVRRAVLARPDSGALLADIVLGQAGGGQLREGLRLDRLRKVWTERDFSGEVEGRLRAWVGRHRKELPVYAV
jgi:hypothetical protein